MNELVAIVWSGTALCVREHRDWLVSTLLMINKHSSNPDLSRPSRGVPRYLNTM